MISLAMACYEACATLFSLEVDLIIFIQPFLTMVWAEVLSLDGAQKFMAIFDDSFHSSW